MPKHFLTMSIFAVLMCAAGLPAQESAKTLTNAAEVLSLSGEGSFGQVVVVQGIVTAAQPDWEGRFFVQDSTGGIFVAARDMRKPAPGDIVEVRGTSHPGGFAPFINDASWIRLGKGELPEPKQVRIEEIMAGIEDGQRIEISGIVRTMRREAPITVFEIVSGGFRLSVRVASSNDYNPERLAGSRVTVRGTAATFFSGQLRQLISVELHVPSASDFVIETMEASDPFENPVLPLNRLAQYSKGRELSERVHVKGVVTCQRPGEDLFLQDATSGLQVRSRQPGRLQPGEVVEAVGFLDFEHFLPVLQDAVFRKTGEPKEKLEPKAVAIWELQAGYRHADLIKLEGRVLDRNVRRTSQMEGQGDVTVLTLQNSTFFFTVECLASKQGEETPAGSLVEVSGVCLMEILPNGRMRSLQLLVSDQDGLRVLQRPSWWTTERLLMGLAALLAVSAIILGWTVMLSRKNADLRRLVGEKVRAQQELQEAHDLLEKRVEERTAQLKCEMTARKEAEVNFRATLAERTRLAQELHDTVEQSFTGIGLQLDAASKLFDRNPPDASHHLDLARTLMTQSQVDLRRSIWDLRSRALEQFDLPHAMRLSASRLVNGQVELEVETKGPLRDLPEIVEENLLRISQEALTNVMKHAGASRVKVCLEFGANSVKLRVQDDGQGFDYGARPGPNQGHFGLLGMSERAKRLGGELNVRSEPGKGTSLEVTIPNEPQELANP